VASLELLYRTNKTNINTEKIYEVSRLVEDLMGVPVQPNKALVGKTASAMSQEYTLTDSLNTPGLMNLSNLNTWDERRYLVLESMWVEKA